MAEIKLKGRSFDQIRRLVSDALKVQYPNANWVWIKDEGLYADTVIYTVEMETGNPRKQTYVASYSIDKANVVTLADIKPAQIKQSVEIASFSFEMPEFVAADFASEGEVIKPCLIFRCGKYPEKGLPEYTQADADEYLIPNFNGLRLEKKHPKIDPVTGETNSEWTGKLGSGGLDAWRVGDEVFANVSFSKLVRDEYKGKRVPLSISIDRATKLPRELSIVDLGHIKGAESLATFSQDTQPIERSGNPMSNFIDKLTGLLGLSKAEVESGVAEFSKSDTSELEARLKAVEAENLTLKQGLSTFSAGQSAEALAKKVLEAKKIVPAQLQEVAASFANAIEMDGANFSKEGSATKTLEKVFENMPEHSFYKPADFSSFSLTPIGGGNEPAKFKDSESVMNQLNGGAN